MTDLADIIAAIERLDRERAALMSQLHAMVGKESSAPQPSAAAASPRLVAKARPKFMLAARAFADRYPLNAWQVRRICANHDWALKLAGTWHVEIDEFIKFADKVDRGEASFDSSEKFASSLANGPQLDQRESASNSRGERKK